VLVEILVKKEAEETEPLFTPRHRLNHNVKVNEKLNRVREFGLYSSGSMLNLVYAIIIYFHKRQAFLDQMSD
jgi:hypothetical protein